MTVFFEFALSGFWTFTGTIILIVVIALAVSMILEDLPAIIRSFFGGRS